MKKLISFCIPCYNEENNVPILYERLVTQLHPFREIYDFEIIFEDNASTDNTQNILKQLAEKDKAVKVIFNSRNYGPMKNGAYIMFQAHGDAVIGLPCDLQVPLTVIKEYISAWEQGYDVVLGQIKTSQENKMMYKARSLYYRIMDNFSDVSQLYHVTGSGLFSNKALALIKSLDEPEPNFRYLVTELGLSYKLIPYDQPKRASGKSSYNVLSYYNQAVGSFTEVSRKPIRYITNTGVCFMGLSILYLIGLIIAKIYLQEGFVLHNWLISAIILFICSFQVFSIGLIGEYLNIILKRCVKRPMVVEKERINFKDILPTQSGSRPRGEKKL